MGSLCCCLRGPEFDDESGDSDDNEQIPDTNAAVSRSTQAHFTSVILNLTNKCEALLGRRIMDPMPSSSRGPSSSQMAHSSSSGSTSSSSSGIGISLTSHDKRFNPSRVEPEPVNERNAQSIPCDGGSKERHPEICLMVALDKVKSKVGILSEDDEDVCPICLEEYTTENPRIVTKCSHHYHLSCIYEWKERSGICPVCSKLMVFKEMA